MSRRFTKIVSAAMAAAISLGAVSTTSAAPAQPDATAVTAPGELIRTEPESTPASLSPNITVVDGISARSAGQDHGDGVTTEQVAGGQQTTFTISSPDADHVRTFDFNLTGNSHIEEIDGFFFIVEAGQPVIRISAPWAKDIHGNEVATWFTTDGQTLTQHVEPTAANNYPLIADPRWNWGRISGHVYFSKEETKKVAAGGAGAAAVGPFWLAVPPPFGPAIGLWWEKNSLQVTETATRAVAGNKCVQLKVGYIGWNGGIGVEPAEYTDGCK